MTSLVEMNEKSLLLSFAKFLELKFYGSGYTASCFEGNRDILCPHSALKDYAQYFCFNGLLAEFRLENEHMCNPITFDIAFCN